VILKRAAIVLGAGASKGALLLGDRTPPLDADFLAVAGNYFSRKQARGKDRAKIQAWRSFKSHLKGAGLDFAAVRSWRLEQLSTYLEARTSLDSLQLGRGRPRKFAEALEALKIVVCHVLQAEGGTRSCALHRNLLRLAEPSVVITFNYDLIADQSMLEEGLLDWRARDYVGATHVRVPSGKKIAYRKIASRKGSNKIVLLKLHGSMHWEKKRRGDGFRMYGCRLPDNNNSLLAYLEAPKKPYIVPPVAAKIEIRQAALRKRWQRAVKLLHDAPVWIIWGYSFPGTDTVSQVLFRAALARNRKPKPVVVVNPDASVVRRVEEVCRKVRVSHYPSVERLLLEHDALSLPGE
jgi:hypothetical protein